MWGIFQLQVRIDIFKFIKKLFLRIDLGWPTEIKSFWNICQILLNTLKTSSKLDTRSHLKKAHNFVFLGHILIKIEQKQAKYQKIAGFQNSRAVVLKLFWLAAQYHQKFNFCQNKTRLWPILVDSRLVLPRSGFYSQIYDHGILWEIGWYFTSPKDRKIRYILCWVEIFWHIFNFLTAQYCAAAHSLRITVSRVQSKNNVYHIVDKVQNSFIDTLVFDLIDNVVFVVFALYSRTA
jgi:hypothetical protein